VRGCCFLLRPPRQQVNSSTFAEMRAANNALGNEVVYMRESVLDVQNLRAIAHATTKQV
jgi:hypothetical protein